MRRLEIPVNIREGRGKNAVAALFSRELTVPKIFFDAPWYDKGQRVDVLAVDRSGAGEVHVAEVASNVADARRVIRRLQAIPAHFKYLATEKIDPFYPNEEAHPVLYDINGYGRIGIVLLGDDGPGDPLSAELIVKPERFRTPPDIYVDIDKYLERHTPDILTRS